MTVPVPKRSAVRGYTRLLLSASVLLAAYAVQQRASARWRALLEPSTPAVEPEQLAAGPTPSPRRSTNLASDVTPARHAYEIEARLDPDSHVVTGRATIHWTNTSSKSQEALWFHLYLNGFRSNSTVFMRAPASARRSQGPLGRPGGTDILYLRAREFGGLNLWENAARHSPDDPNDATDIRVPLPRPLPPHATLDLELSFKSVLPELVERSGYSGDFHMVAQWYPKLARLHSDGTWSHFTYHSQAEFDADFADYRVTLEVPNDYVVGATGRLLRQELHNGRRTELYEAARVHDFAWTAWPHFVSERYRTADIEVLQLFPPGHTEAQAAARKTVERALTRLEASYGEYPYPNLTVVHPPSTAAPACGMEYPTLITTGGGWYSPLLGLKEIETVTVHELAHQWFYGVVASNEHRWPFLDEGLASFAEMRILDSTDGLRGVSTIGPFRLSRLAEFCALAADAPAKPSMQSATDFDGFFELGALAYARPALALETLARTYGRARLEQALRAYARGQRFRHAEPTDLLEEVTNHVGPDATRTLKQALAQGATLDFRIRWIEHAKSPGRDQVTSRILIERGGALVLPVQILLIDAAGNSDRIVWDSSTPVQWLEYRGTAPIVSAVVDPENRVLLDRSRLNNAKSLSPSRLLGLQALVNWWAQAAIQGLSL